MNTNDVITDDFTQVEQRLAEAGISFTVVDACPVPECDICLPTPVPAAA